MTENKNKEVWEWVKSFFLPKSLADLGYMLLTIAVAYYVFTYSLPPGMEESTCEKYYITKVCPCAIKGPDMGILKDPLTGMPLPNQGSNVTIPYNITP